MEYFIADIFKLFSVKFSEQISTFINASLRSTRCMGWIEVKHVPDILNSLVARAFILKIIQQHLTIPTYPTKSPETYTEKNQFKPPELGHVSCGVTCFVLDICFVNAPHVLNNKNSSSFVYHV